jgi:hypothetical protein
MRRWLQLLLVVMLGGCSSGYASDTDEARDQPVGKVAVQLQSSVGGHIYQLTGQVRLSPVYPSTTSAQFDLMASTDATQTFSVPAGSYTAYLAPWTLTRDTGSGPQPVDAELIDAVGTPVVVLANVSSALTFHFRVAGVTIPFDPCVPNPNVLACPTGDLDGDGVANATDPAPMNFCIPIATPGPQCGPSVGDVNVGFEVVEWSVCDYGPGVVVPRIWCRVHTECVPQPGAPFVGTCLSLAD